MRSGHAEWEGCLEGCVGGRLCPPWGGALNYRLCVSHFLKDSGPRLQRRAPQREQQRLPERKAVLKGSLVAFY